MNTKNNITLLALCSIMILISSCGVFQKDYTGSYEMKGEIGPKGEDILGPFGGLDIKKIEDKTYALSFSINRGAPSYNMGGFNDTLELKKNKLFYKADPEIDSTCVITFTFEKNGVQIDQKSIGEGQCGFGHGVSAVGYFKKTSSEEPILYHPFTGEKL